jgi:hypothetical protein
MSNVHNEHVPVRQPRRRRRRGSYQLSIERRAAIATGMIKENGRRCDRRLLTIESDTFSDKSAA